MSVNGPARLPWSPVALLVLAVTASCSRVPDPAVQPAPPDESMRASARGDVLTREQIERIRPLRMRDLFEGRFTGVQVATVGGQQTLVIRGAADPLILVNGTPVAETQSLWSMDPSDIEQIEILKGTQASLYGIDGASGVVLITTRVR